MNPLLLKSELNEGETGNTSAHYMHPLFISQHEFSFPMLRSKFKQDQSWIFPRIYIITTVKIHFAKLLPDLFIGFGVVDAVEFLHSLRIGMKDKTDSRLFFSGTQKGGPAATLFRGKSRRICHVVTRTLQRPRTICVQGDWVLVTKSQRKCELRNTDKCKEARYA